MDLALLSTDIFLFFHFISPEDIYPGAPGVGGSVMAIPTAMETGSAPARYVVGVGLEQAPETFQLLSNSHQFSKFLAWCFPDQMRTHHPGAQREQSFADEPACFALPKAH